MSYDINSTLYPSYELSFCQSIPLFRSDYYIKLYHSLNTIQRKNNIHVVLLCYLNRIVVKIMMLILILMKFLMVICVLYMLLHYQLPHNHYLSTYLSSTLMFYVVDMGVRLDHIMTLLDRSVVAVPFDCMLRV